MGAYADIIHHKHFDKTVIKVLVNDQKKQMIKRFKQVDGVDLDLEINDDRNRPMLNFAEESLRRAKLEVEAMAKKSSYYHMKHIASNSNIAERRFSRSKIIKRDHRKHMSPYYLEMLLFLRCTVIDIDA